MLFPTVVLLSAVSTLIGAGAHLIADQLLRDAAGEGIGFLRWLLLGLPLAVVSCHLAAEVVLLLFTSRADRRDRLDWSRDALAALAEQFNAMLDRLEHAFATQRRFLDDAGHELRTPITIVSGHLELMGDDPAERAEAVRLCADELDRMNRVVGDLLLLAKAEQPDFITPAPADVAELTSDLYAKVRAIGDRHWRLEAIGEGEVRLDEQRVTQAVVQLAQNAVQHTEAGSEVLIGSAVRDGVASFWVADRGPGVRPEDAGAIFERFGRGSTGGAAGHRAGAGLGLAIVRAIAEAHHGLVRLTSTPGAGARFAIGIPTRTGGTP
ncbi:sensor histidine kinase [Saccharothrix lopnurensis]|uniref:histidine kinase n=1 Tax=Saccharothrix lopnurensis TaxID=1670621 RepID=A0ABW1PIR7_9PSEU